MRPCEVKGRKATFHTWTQQSWVVPPSPMIGGHPGGQMSTTWAVVEYEDGTVHEVCPTDIRFTDKEEKADV